MLEKAKKYTLARYGGLDYALKAAKVNFKEYTDNKQSAVTVFNEFCLNLYTNRAIKNPFPKEYPCDCNGVLRLKSNLDYYCSNKKCRHYTTPLHGTPKGAECI